MDEIYKIMSKHYFLKMIFYAEGKLEERCSNLTGSTVNQRLWTNYCSSKYGWMKIKSIIKSP